MKSPSFVSAPVTPFPPRRCLRYEVSGSRLMYPSCEMVTAISSSGIRSSCANSSAGPPISVRRSSPYCSFIS